MGSFFDFVGVLMLAGLIGYNAAQHGKRWSFGRYCMPHSLIVDDGMHYFDGSEVDPVTALLAQKGVEEELFLVLVVSSTLVLTWCFWRQRRAGSNNVRTRRATTN